MAEKKKKATGVGPWIARNIIEPPRRQVAKDLRAFGSGIENVGGAVSRALYSPASQQPANIPGVSQSQLQDFFGDYRGPSAEYTAGTQPFQLTPNPMGAGTPGAGGGGQDLMAMYSQLMGQMLGPAPSMNFDAAPYQQAIEQMNQQAGLNRQAIEGHGTDLMARLAELRGQHDVRMREDQGAIQAMQQRALQGAQGAVSPVLADLQAQGVNTAALQQGANNRIGVMQDQASSQNILGQRLAENARQVMDATQRSSVLQGTGALNQLQGNLSNVVNQIGGEQAKAFGAAQSQYLKDLAAYNRSKLGAASDVLGFMGKTAGGGGDDPAAIRAEWEADGSQTGQEILNSFNRLDSGESPQMLIDELNAPPPEGADVGDAKTTREWLKNNGVDVSTLEKQIRAYGKPKKSNNTNMAAALKLLGG